jgi:deazaflavin-dependent oxidoreductase (nitroreductase family)
MASARLKLLKALGESSFWRRAGTVHTWLYRRTGGRLGHWSGHVNSLLLTTIGRKSGEARTVPLAYLVDGDRYVLVASNGGADRHPAWWLNLEHTPSATVQVGAARVDVVASRADVSERDRLWPQLKEVNPFFGWYERITDRDIPVVILRPRGP